MRKAIVSALKKTPLRYWWARYRVWRGSKSQSDESAILSRLFLEVDAPKSFVEFGFHINEFNCIELAKSYPGLLIDGDPGQVKVARRMLPERVETENRFLSLDNLDIIFQKYPPGTLGVLSIDVDGNDYWFLKHLLAIKPAIISVEYNASFGLREITVPYDPKFRREEKHPTHWYHGASITSLDRLCTAHGYDLVAVSNLGINLFFVRSDLRPASMPKLSAKESFLENSLRNKWSGTTASEQWHKIEQMHYESPAP